MSTEPTNPIDPRALAYTVADAAADAYVANRTALKLHSAYLASTRDESAYAAYAAAVIARKVADEYLDVVSAQYAAARTEGGAS